MDTAFAALRNATVIAAVIAVAFGIYLHQLAAIAASAAATSAAAAAARTLDGGDWDCTGAGPRWTAAEGAAAGAAAARTAAGSTAVATDYSLSADPACTVVASVTVAAAGAHRWLAATAVACRPTRHADHAGWALTPTC